MWPCVSQALNKGRPPNYDLKAGAFVLKIGLRQPLALDLSGWWEARVAVPKATARAESLGFFQAPGPLEGHL